MLTERNDIPNQRPEEKIYAAKGGALVKVRISQISPAGQDFSFVDSVSMLVSAIPVGADGLMLQDNGTATQPPARTVTIPLGESGAMDPQAELDEAIAAAVEGAANWTIRATKLRQVLAPWTPKPGT